jgi:hypothetical protein
MTAQTETMAMDIDSDNSASVRSDSSQTLYTDDYESLPSNGPDSHAHIVDLIEYADLVKEVGTVKLQDAVVTTLHNVSPTTLRAFLSPTVNTFRAILGKKDVQLVVWRKGLEVFVSVYALKSRALVNRFSRSAHLRTTLA